MQHRPSVERPASRVRVLWCPSSFPKKHPSGQSICGFCAPFQKIRIHAPPICRDELPAVSREIPEISPGPMSAKTVSVAPGKRLTGREAVSPRRTG